MIFTRIPNSSFYCCCPPDDHLQEAGPSFCQPQKGQEKCIFETLHNEIECVLSIKESNFNEKISYLLMVRPRVPHLWSAWPQNISSLTPPFRRIFYGRADCKRIPPPPFSQLFVNFFGVFFILDYDSMCSETDFTEKVNFHATTEISNFSSYCCSSHSGWIFLK